MKLAEAKEVLRNHGWRQNDLAEYLGYTQAMISMLLNGKANSGRPEAIRKIKRLARICKEMDKVLKIALRR